jgi:hypothetical protein
MKDACVHVGSSRVVPRNDCKWRGKRAHRYGSTVPTATAKDQSNSKIAINKATRDLFRCVVAHRKTKGYAPAPISPLTTQRVAVKFGATRGHPPQQRVDLSSPKAKKNARLFYPLPPPKSRPKWQKEKGAYLLVPS